METVGRVGRVCPARGQHAKEPQDGSGDSKIFKVR